MGTALHLAVGKGYKTVSKDGQPLTVTNLDLVRKLVIVNADCRIQDIFSIQSLAVLFDKYSCLCIAITYACV